MAARQVGCPDGDDAPILKLLQGRERFSEFFPRRCHDDRPRISLLRRVYFSFLSCIIISFLCRTRISLLRRASNSGCTGGAPAAAGCLPEPGRLNAAVSHWCDRARPPPPTTTQDEVANTIETGAPVHAEQSLHGTRNGASSYARPMGFAFLTKAILLEC